MKQFIHPDAGHGPNPDPTMTVGELIAALQNYPAEMPVITVGEGMFGPMKAEDFEILESTDERLIESTLSLTGEWG